MPISTDAIALFLKSAIESAAWGEPAGRLGSSIRNIAIDDNRDVRFELDDGSRVNLEIHHLVPRGYFDGAAAAPSVLQKPIDTMSVEELRLERAYWDTMITGAPAWGAALSAAAELRAACDAMLARREREQRSAGSEVAPS